ncbi:MAG: DNA methyltransferase [Sedimentisphaerales bacterium]
MAKNDRPIQPGMDSTCSPQVKRFKLNELHPAKYNPRTITDDALAGLAESIKKFGCVEPIIVNTRGGANTIVGGNQRFKVLQAAKVKEAICITVNLSEIDEKLLNITLNNPLIQGEFIKNLAAYIDSMRKNINDDVYLNLRIGELRESMGGEEKAGNILDDEIPEPPKKAITKPGDLWILGQHKLLCGDSTNETDVAQLMGKERAKLFATDPPYCIDYTGANRPVKKPKDWSNVYHEVDIKDPKAFMLNFLTAGLKYTIPKAPIYLWHADKRDVMIRQLLDELELFVHQTIIWVKPCVILGFAFYAYRHEPCFLIWRKGSRARPTKFGRKHDPGTVWPVGWVKKGDPTEPEYYTDVWELDWEGKKRNSGLEHPTVKPVEVFAIPMRVHTKVGDICYEPFCGSGSQIIAAEKLDRRCFAMELEPVFCDVVVKRWEQWTGKKAKLVKDGHAGPG